MSLDGAGLQEKVCQQRFPLDRPYTEKQYLRGRITLAAEGESALFDSDRVYVDGLPAAYHGEVDLLAVGYALGGADDGDGASYSESRLAGPCIAGCPCGVRNLLADLSGTGLGSAGSASSGLCLGGCGQQERAEGECGPYI